MKNGGWILSFFAAAGSVMILIDFPHGLEFFASGRFTCPGSLLFFGISRTLPTLKIPTSTHLHLRRRRRVETKHPSQFLSKANVSGSGEFMYRWWGGSHSSVNCLLPYSRTDKASRRASNSIKLYHFASPNCLFAIRERKTLSLNWRLQIRMPTRSSIWVRSNLLYRYGRAIPRPLGYIIENLSI